MTYSQSFSAISSPGAGAHDLVNETTGRGSPGAPGQPVGEGDAQRPPPPSSGASPPSLSDSGGKQSPGAIARVAGDPGEDDRGRQHPTTAGKKKKGTASAVKAPKRLKPGSRRTKPPGGRRTRAGAGPGGADGNGDAAEGDEEADDDGSDSGPYCICRGPDNHRFMIACDQCEDWFHGECIGMDKYTGENLVQRYICPNCTDGKAYVTRYKKTCALEGCQMPARIYDPKDGSIFCSDEHCHAWWEQLVATLPRLRPGHHSDVLTQEEFISLVTPTSADEGGRGRGWRLGDDPFGAPRDFWDADPPADALTAEETAFLTRSASERHRLGEEIMLCKKMLQLVEAAAQRRDAAVAARGLGKDFCGYDARLDTVGATAAFGAFVRSPAGEAAAAAAAAAAVAAVAGGVAGGDDDDDGGGGGLAVCARRKCKPHMQWAGVLTKTVKHQIKELAALAREKLDAEARVRDGAAVRYRRRMKENNWVTAVESESDMDVD